MNRKRMLGERFWNNVEIKDRDSCWEWKLTKTEHGYGRINVNRKIHKAHRIAWMLTYGEMPQLFVCHKCDNPACCNPTHLFLGTHEDNQKDKVAKGRQSKGEKHSSRPNTCGEECATSKLTENQVLEIRQSSDSSRVLARRYNISRRQVGRIKHSESWRHLYA